jgi:hypothetical protein
MEITPSHEIPTNSYDSIYDVISLARRLANKDYDMHLEKVANAKSKEQLDMALENASASYEAVCKIFKAELSLASSKIYFQKAPLLMMTGEVEEAQKVFNKSGKKMSLAADQLSQFADYIPKSRSMNLAIEFIARADGVIVNTSQKIDAALKNFETAAVRTSEGLSLGLKVFSKTMTDFAEKIVSAPKKIKKVAAEKAMSVREATAEVASGFFSRVRQLAKKSTFRFWSNYSSQFMYASNS